jgi:hypothetical protein
MGAAEGLRDAYAGIRADALALAGEPGDMPRRVAAHHSVFLDSRGNHVFPEVALHGALWAYGFYESTGTVSRLVSYRYFYSGRERARRAAMLADFSEGFKEANRSVFVDTYTNYHFTKRFGEEAEAEELVPPALLELLNRMHRATRSGHALAREERGALFEASLRFEQERTVGPKVREEVAKFDCPILTKLVLKPIVRFAYFPRLHYMFFDNFGDTEERIARALESYELAERAGWERVAASIEKYGVMSAAFFADPIAYGRFLTE